LKGCAEVSLNLLGPGEAVDLLLGTAQIKDADDVASAAAAEIAVLCGNLPLYISICGGVIAGYEDDGSWKTEVVGMLVEDRVGLIEDSTGDRTVGRLVDSSLTMLKDEQTSLVFMALGVCPEDVLVELPVAQLVCGADADVAATGKLSSMSMRRIVKTLLDRHLLQGSAAKGVQMHDIVRDLVRSRLGGEDGIRAKQRVVVAAMVSASPTDGWTPEDAVGLYVEQALETHMAEALLASPLSDMEAQGWLLHSSTAIVTNAATVFGSATLEVLSAAKEGAGELVGAARVAWAARAVRGLPGATSTDLAFRAADLLERLDDPSCAKFEAEVLTVCCLRDWGSERQANAQNRHAAVEASVLQASGVGTGTETFSSKWSEAMQIYTKGTMVWSWWASSPLAAVRAGSSQMRQAWLTSAREASSLSNIPYERHCEFGGAVCIVILCSHCSFLSQVLRWQMDSASWLLRCRVTWTTGTRNSTAVKLHSSTPWSTGPRPAVSVVWSSKRTSR
jgi:hypothetical protein